MIWVFTGVVTVGRPEIAKLTVVEWSPVVAGASSVDPVVVKLAMVESATVSDPAGIRLVMS